MGRLMNLRQLRDAVSGAAAAVMNGAVLARTNDGGRYLLAVERMSTRRCLKVQAVFKRRHARGEVVGRC
jgi:hypothetical protein